MDTVSPEQRSQNMAKIRSRDTAPERTVRSLLHRRGYRFRLHRKDLAGKPDIVFPGRKAVIFVNGCFWHGHDCPRGRRPSSNQEFWQRKITANQTRDRQSIQNLELSGWRVLTLWGCEMKDTEALGKKLVDFLDLYRS